MLPPEGRYGAARISNTDTFRRSSRTNGIASTEESVKVERNPLQNTSIFVVNTGGQISQSDVRERLATDRKVVCPPQLITPVETTRIRQRESLDKRRLIETFIGNTVAIVDIHGNTYQVDSHRIPGGYIQTYSPNGHPVVLNRATLLSDGTYSSSNITDVALHGIQELLTVPINPYVGAGGIHLMGVEIGNEDAHTIIDFEPHVLKRKFRQRALLLTQMQKNGGSVALGNNLSPFSLEGKNMQSVLWAHYHALQMGLLTPDQVIALREQRWDDGLSLNFGMELIEVIGNTILPNYDNKVDLRADDMGFTMKFENLKPEDIGKDEFLNNLLVPLYGAIQAQIAQTHELLFTSKYDDVRKLIDQGRKNGGLTEEEEQEYKALFTLKPEDIHQPKHIRELRKLHIAGEAKQPPGAVVTFLFSDDGSAIAAVTSGYLKDEPLGPAEALGSKIVRLSASEIQVPTEEELSGLSKEYQIFTSPMTQAA